MAENINGPSLVRAPPWIDEPLGAYYLYFANHQGRYIYLAYADTLDGPWTMYEPGTLHIDDTALEHHVASPDVHLDHETKTVWLYYHGVSDYDTYMQFDGPGGQASGVAQSHDGLNFESTAGPFATPYLRRFRYRDVWYFLGGRGHLYRRADEYSDLETGPTVFPDEMRHPAVRRSDDRLFVYYSNRGDRPERIFRSTLDLSRDWREWEPYDETLILEPETPYEGGNQPISESTSGFSRTPVRQVRDPAIFEDEGERYLLYSVAGERGIAIARLRE
ncbi:hypothetical protein [Haloarcula nitratireducens]|uniref:Uncharacterized protein n=1 Tax=Haloarcula nitratireducens TaxID=2487749 RepID=A0AAW4PGC4_9EURY|nr:hypothetical protein [Halomicroarcula nitratireducens]MBX0296956.1 hypothetical protein [Halomicroarcula nitratireducens]